MALDLVLRSRRVVTSGACAPASIHVENGRIAAIAAHGEVPPGAPLVDVGELVVAPGIVDSHVHVNEPGRTEWEGFRTATRAAAAGGVTTLVDMPLNSIPPTTTVANLERKRAAAAGQCWIDVGFWGGAVPGNAGDLGAMLDAGALGFKAFLVESGVDEFGYLRRPDLEAAMHALAASGAPLLVHAELPGPIEAAAAAIAGLDPRLYATYLRSRPPEAEDLAVALLAELCRSTGARAHVVHLSSAGALEPLRKARDAGLRLTAETTPHYLHFAAETIPDGATPFKCAPPIRSAENRDLLWAALDEGLLDFVVSDHSPCSPALKKLEAGDFNAAWGGIASLQLGLPIVWTDAKRRGGSPIDLAGWMSEGPARLAGLSHKGLIAVGRDADFVVWDPDASFRVEAAALEHRHPVTPYAGEELQGVVVATYLRGVPVYRHQRDSEPGGRLGDAATGRLIRRGAV